MVIVDISKIRDEIGETMPISLTVRLHDLDESDSWVHGDIILHGQISNVGKTLRLRCEVTSQATLECCRCLSVYEQSVKFDFEAELEPESFKLGADVLDIAPFVREELIFQAPMKPLCHQDCKGLCPYCGIDLNQSACECGQRIVDPRLSKLQHLLES